MTNIIARNNDEIKITDKTDLIYDYFSDTVITLHDKKCFYYEDSQSIDRYQLRLQGSDEIIICTDTKTKLLDYLIHEDATIGYGQTDRKG